MSAIPLRFPCNRCLRQSVVTRASSCIHLSPVYISCALRGMGDDLPHPQSSRGRLRLAEVSRTHAAFGTVFREQTVDALLVTNQLKAFIFEPKSKLFSMVHLLIGTCVQVTSLILPDETCDAPLSDICHNGSFRLDHRVKLHDHWGKYSTVCPHQKTRRPASRLAVAQFSVRCFMRRVHRPQKCSTALELELLPATLPARASNWTTRSPTKLHHPVRMTSPKSRHVLFALAVMTGVSWSPTSKEPC